MISSASAADRPAFLRTLPSVSDLPTLPSIGFVTGVTAAGTEATAAIADRFGLDILAADGAVDRRKLGPIVFADPAARRELEAITHPAVYRAINAGLRAFELVGDGAFAVVGVPLLFETGAEKGFDKVIVTACAPQTQLARLIERGLSEDAARQRLAAQWPTDQKVARADFVVTTDGAFAETERQVDEIHRALTA